MGFLSKLFKREIDVNANTNTEGSVEPVLEETATAIDAVNTVIGNTPVEEPAPAVTPSGSASFEVEDVFTISGRGTVVTGRVTAGEFRVGDQVILRGKQVELVGIEMFRKTLDSVTTGDNAGLLLGGISRDEVSRGDIITK